MEGERKEGKKGRREKQRRKERREGGQEERREEGKEEGRKERSMYACSCVCNGKTKLTARACLTRTEE